MLAPNLDPGSSAAEIAERRRTRCPQQRDFLSAQWSRGSGVVDSRSAVLDHATVDGKSVPLKEEHT